VVGWTSLKDAGAIKVYKVSGSLTNAVFFVSHPEASTLLLRIYGASSSSLISRIHELHTLHVLSSRYGIGPRVYGTFDNGRVEEYFASDALTAEGMREGEVSRWIGMRMAELHRVDVRLVDTDTEGDGVERNVRRWLPAAWEVVRLARGEEARRLAGVDLGRFEGEWERYWGELMDWERVHGRSPRVFAHNDTQYGNLLRLRTPPVGQPPHHRIIVVDFEYAAVNTAAYDIANHFHEWTANYHDELPHCLNPARYPTLAQRINFYKGYLGPDPSQEEVSTLEKRVQRWSAASHGMWALWGVVQAREMVLTGAEKDDFDYIGYALSRMGLFRDYISISMVE